MALVLADRVRETTTTTGTGTVSLAGPVSGFQGFSTAIGNANTTYYTIADAATGAWEVGLGTYTSSGSTLARTTILSSSNAGAAVNFAAGTKDVFVTQPAERALYLNGAGTGIDAGAAAFTANGVVYASSTSALATGSALTFDGTEFKVNAASGNVLIQPSNVANAKLYMRHGSIGNNSGFEVDVSSNILFLHAGTEKLRLTATSLYTASDVNVGIGTSSTSQRLTIDSADTERTSISLSNSSVGGGFFNIAAVGSATWLGAPVGSLLIRDSNAGVSRIVLDSAGNVGIGTSSPSQRLSLQGSSTTYALAETTGTGTSSGFRMKAGASADYTLFTTQGVNQFAIYDNIASSERLTLLSNGNLGIGTPTPAVRLQSNIATNGAPVTSGTTQTNGALRLSATSATGGILDFGVNGVNPWIQATNYTDLSQTYNILLNPNGGNVGIGETSPAAKLHIGVASAAVDGTKGVRITNPAGTIAVFECGSVGDSFIGTTSGSDFNIRTNNALVATFLNGGNVGIGTSTPFTRLESAAARATTLNSTASFNTMAASVTDTTAFAVGVGGGINFRAQLNASTYNTYASIWSFRESGTTDDYKGSLIFGTSDNGDGYPEERMRLESTGNLGIGTSSPGARLHVSSSGSEVSRFQTSGADMYLRFVNSFDTNGYIGYQNAAMTFWTYNTVKATLDSAGNFGVGETSPSSFGVIVAKKDQTADTAISVSNQGTTNAATTMSFTLNEAGVPGGWFRRYRDGSGNTEVGFSDALLFTGNVNTSKVERARISSDGTFRVKGAGTAGSTDAFQVAGTAPADAARIDSSGNLLVGTTSGTGDRIYASGYIRASSGFKTDGTTWIDSPVSEAMRFVTNNTERARITSDGDLLVGTTTSGFSTGTGAFVRNAASSNTYLGVNHNSASTSGADFAAFGYNGTQIGGISQSGTTAVLYNVTSDQRLKENVVDAPEFGSVIDSLQVRSFDWITDQTHQRAGFIAQELVTVAPEAVHQPADPEAMMAVDYSKLVPMLVKEIQALRARVASLESSTLQ